MRFDCDRKRRRLVNWHRKFLWWPTKVAPGDCRWLEWVNRQGRVIGHGPYPFWTWEYAVD